MPVIVRSRCEHCNKDDEFEVYRGQEVYFGSRCQCGYVRGFCVNYFRPGQISARVHAKEARRAEEGA